MTSPHSGPGWDRHQTKGARRRATNDEHCTCEVVCSRPTPNEERPERWLFEWTLDWADCEGVIDVSVARVPDRAPDGAADRLLQVSIQTEGECETVRESTEYRRLLERLEAVADVLVVACYRAERPTVPIG